MRHAVSELSESETDTHATMSAASISTSNIDEGTELELWEKPHQPHPPPPQAAVSLFLLLRRR